MIKLTNIKYYFRKSIYNKLIKKSLHDQPAVLIFQMGKVGSTYLYQYFQKLWVLDLIKTHSAREAEVFLKNNSNQKIYIFCGIREPLALSMSTFFQNCTDSNAKYFYFGNKSKLLSSKLNEIKEFFDAKLPMYVEEYLTPWFDQFQDVTGVSLGELEKHHGFWSCERDNLEIYIYRLEDMNHLIKYLEKHRDFGIKRFKHVNVGDEKWYGETYTEFKNKYEISLENYIHTFKNVKWLSFFYDEDELINYAKTYIID